MRFGQLVVDRQRLLGGVRSNGHRLLRRQLQNISQNVTVGESRVSQRVLWIDLNCFLEIFNGLVDVLRFSLVPVIASLPVKFVGLGIRGVPFDELLLLLACQL